jgi:hypothetical protein
MQDPPDTELERSDPHEMPLDDDDDARYLHPHDPRRQAAERRKRDSGTSSSRGFEEE